MPTIYSDMPQLWMCDEGHSQILWFQSMADRMKILGDSCQLCSCREDRKKLREKVDELEAKNGSN